MHRALVLSLVLAAAFAAAGPPHTTRAADNTADKADPTDALFDGKTVLQLTLEVAKAERDSLRREPRKYVKATLKDGDKTYPDVGVHLKGAIGSFQPFDGKPGLTLNMDKFTDGQRFRGMDKFHLANSVQDPTYLSELVCGELFRAAGVPASRVAHAVVRINDRKVGLYYLKEGYDSHFLKRHFKTSHGNFYDGGFLRDIDQPLHLVSGKDDVPDRRDLKALVAASREPDRAKRFEKLAAVLDVDRFVSYMVVEAITWDWDGYPFKCNNYRIYHDPARDKLVFIPSGMDQMFWDVNGPVLPDFQGMVARGLLETPEGKKRYFDRMAEVMKTVYDPDKIVRRLDELEKVVQPALASVDTGAGRDYKNQVDRLRGAVRQRAKSIDEQLKRMKK